MTTTELSEDLLLRYDVPGPRYTSYPTALQFRDDFGPADYARIARGSNEDPIPRPLSIYVHIPFCQSLCYYCACNKIVTRNQAKAQRYVKYLVRELDLQRPLFDRDRAVTQLHLGGGTPTFLSDDQLSQLMRDIGRRFQLESGPGREFSIELDPRATRPGTLSLLADLGFNRLSIGVQDFDVEVQAAVNRIQPLEQTAELLERARQAGFTSVSLDLIYGLPRQTSDTFERTLDTVLTLQPERLSVYSYAHLPDKVPAQRLIKAADLPGPAEKLRMLARSVERLTAAGYRYIGMDHFALPNSELARALEAGSLQRNFQGYSTHEECDLIGLGVSAIGSVSGCLHQNTRDLKTYYARLDEDTLPVVRGLIPSPEDRLRQAVIQQVLCRAWLSFAEIEDRFEIDFAAHFAAELEAMTPLERDGLVRRERDGVAILPRGRLLLRNIAMLFDAYLFQAHEEAGSYSRTI